MLSQTIAFALSQRLLMLLAALALCVAGFFAFEKLPIDAFPDVSMTQVQIIMKAAGMTPEEVESQVVLPIEQDLLGIPHQVMLRSQSKYAIAVITLDFAEGTDPYWARQQVAERLSGVLGNLPSTVSGGLAPMTTPLGEMFMFSIEGNLSLMEKRQLLERVIRPQLRTITGVADVNSLGGHVRTFEVQPNLSAMAARGISLAMLEQAIQANHQSDGAGRLSDQGESMLVRSDSRVRSLDDLNQIVVTEQQGVPVYVSDVATTQIGSLSRYGAVTQNGQGEAVEGIVLGLRGANARQVVADVRQALDHIQTTLPKGVTIKPFYDRGDLVNRAIHTVQKSLAEAIVLVLILLLLFLGNIRAACVVATILPLSALVTFLLMRQFGLSANLMSLGGLAIAIGLLVDAAVVVVENIEAHQAKTAHTPVHRAPLHVIFRAVQEVAVPVTAGMIIIMLVFVPLLSLQGLEGKLFAPVAMTIVFALSVSLLLSLTVIPVLASFLLKPHGGEHPWLVRHLEHAYQRVLRWSLAHSKIVYGCAGAALLGAVVLYPLIGKSFMPTLDEGDIIMQVEKIPSIALHQSVAMDLQIQQRILSQVPEVERIVARTGSDELGLDPMGLNETDTFLVLKPRDQWQAPNKDAIIEHVRQALQDVAGVNFSFTQPIEMRTSEMLSGVRGDLAVKIYGDDFVTLDALAQQVAGILQGIKGSEDVITTENSGVQYLNVDIDRLAAAQLGLSSEEIQQSLRRLVEGKPIGQVVENNKPVPLMIKGDESLRLSPQQFAQIQLPIATGQTVALSQVARLVSRDGLVRIDRENASRMAVVRSNVTGRDLVSFVDDAKRAVAQQVKLPSGYRITWGGQFENQQRAAARLAVVVPLALGMIFFLLFVTLGSIRQAVLVFVNIPFALIGGVVALAITNEYLSVPASVGFIALMGIAVLNGLVMISYFNQLLARGMPVVQVVYDGALRRLRPVLMTATIAAFGLVPLLLATGPGSEIQRPLAIVVIGGLVSSTLLTLILLPNLFRRFGVERVQ
jgi:cobalt-zinc-cadmium resistance protein CzcA